MQVSGAFSRDILTNPVSYTFTYKGITRELPIYEVGGGVRIAYLDSFCDLELVRALSVEMADKIAENPVFLSAEKVVIITAVSKGVPFAYIVGSMLQERFADKKIEIAIARKEIKKFFGEVVTIDKLSITSLGGNDLLALSESDAAKLAGASTIVLDDMYSTGASIVALEKLAEKCGANVIDRVVAVWETGNENELPPVKYCATLPLVK